MSNCGAPFLNKKDLDLHFVEVHKQRGKKPGAIIDFSNF